LGLFIGQPGIFFDLAEESERTNLRKQTKKTPPKTMAVVVGTL